MNFLVASTAIPIPAAAKPAPFASPERPPTSTLAPSLGILNPLRSSLATSRMLSFLVSTPTPILRSEDFFASSSRLLIASSARFTFSLSFLYSSDASSICFASFCPYSDCFIASVRPLYTAVNPITSRFCVLRLFRMFLNSLPAAPVSSFSCLIFSIASLMPSENPSSLSDMFSTKVPIYFFITKYLVP